MLKAVATGLGNRPNLVIGLSFADLRRLLAEPGEHVMRIDSREKTALAWMS